MSARAATGARETAPVLLGAGPDSPAQTVEFAFGEADRRGVPLWAVRAWWDPDVDLGRPQDAHLARWDAACRRESDDLTAQLSAAVCRYPGVAVRPVVVNDHPAAVLAALAARAQLLVLGPPAGDGGDSSPASVLVRTAPCPVVVVPSPLSRPTAAAARLAAGVR